MDGQALLELIGAHLLGVRYADRLGPLDPDGGELVAKVVSLFLKGAAVAVRSEGGLKRRYGGLHDGG